MPTDAWAIRAEARAATRLLVDARPALARIGSIDLGPAIEHAIFIALRGGSTSAAGPGGPPWRGALPRIVARAIGARRHRRPTPAAGAVVMLPVSDVHRALWRTIDHELATRGRSSVVAVPILGGRCRHQPHEFCARAHLDATWLPALARHAELTWSSRREIAAALATRPGLDGTVVAALPRLALASAQLDSMLRWTRPSVVVCYNEVGPLSRLAPAVAHGLGIEAVDLPHAEAADAPAIAGIDYDAVGVFGDRAVVVMAEAGVPRDRVVAIGAPHVDQLIEAAATQPRPSERRIVFASQSLGGAMTAEVKERTLQATLAVAAAVAPARLVIRPHPLETDDLAASVLQGPIPAGVEVSVERDQPLVAHLAGAWALVTAWSNTAYEAAVLGVPVIAINATAGPPVLPLAEDSVALGATDEATAATAARTLLVDAVRDDLVRAATEGVRRHLGPLDGRSAARAADLILAHVRPGSAT